MHRPGRDSGPHGGTPSIFALSYALSSGYVDFVDDPPSGRQVHQTLVDAPQTLVDIHQCSGDIHQRAVDAPRTLSDIHRNVVDIHPILAHVHAPLGDAAARAADIAQRASRWGRVGEPPAVCGSLQRCGLEDSTPGTRRVIGRPSRSAYHAKCPARFVPEYLDSKRCLADSLK